MGASITVPDAPPPLRCAQHLPLMGRNRKRTLPVTCLQPGVLLTEATLLSVDYRKLAVISNPEETDMTTGQALNQITPVRAPVIAVQTPTVIRNPDAIQ